MTEPKRQPKKPPVNGRRKAAKAAETPKAEEEPKLARHVAVAAVRRARRR